MRKRPTNPLIEPFNPKLASCLARIMFHEEGRSPVPIEVSDSHVQFRGVVHLKGHYGKRASNWDHWINALALHLSFGVVLQEIQAKFRDKATALLADMMTGPIAITDLELWTEHMAILEEMYGPD